MTNQEAIKILDNLKPGDYSNPYEKGEAIVMAIEALQAQPESLVKESRTLVKDLVKDTISRQAAIDIVNGYETRLNGYIGTNNDSEVYAYARGLLLSIQRNIDALPSAQPKTAKRIVGKSRNGMTLWYQCDMCNEPVDAQDNFCRGCGRRLTNG